MNTQKSKAEYTSDYQSYGQEPCFQQLPNARPAEPNRVELEIEREMSLQEYQNDREAILLAIKDALKNRRYNEAQEFVYKYRAAAKNDEDFRVLAKMTASGLEKSQSISKFVTALDATPDDDYSIRLELCKRILNVQPENETYQKELERCQNALHIKADNPKKSSSVANPQLGSVTGTLALIAFSLSTLFNIFLLIGVNIDSDIKTIAASIFSFIVATIIEGRILIPRKDKPKYGISGLLFRLWFAVCTFWLWVFALMITTGAL